MNVLTLSSAPYGSFKLSKQLVSIALGELGHDVLYVEPPVSPLSMIRRRSRLGALLGSTESTPDTNVRVWQPRVLPGQNSAIGQAANALLLHRGIRRRMPSPDLVLAFSLESRAVFRALPGTGVYYATDSLEDNALLSRDVIKWEADMCAKADVVVACSLGLQRQFADRGVSAVYAPHGCDDAFLSVERDDIPELAGRPRPFVGYVGGLNARIDTALLEAAQRGAGGGTLVIIGSFYGSHAGVDAAAERLMARNDVVVIGEKNAAELPRYVAALDVGIAPYVDDGFNRKSFPLKIPQYLGTGAACVSTVNGATEEYGAAVLVAETPDAFEAAVAKAAADSSPASRAARRAVAARRTWKDVATQVLALT